MKIPLQQPIEVTKTIQQTETITEAEPDFILIEPGKRRMVVKLTAPAIEVTITEENYDAIANDLREALASHLTPHIRAALNG